MQLRIIVGSIVLASSGSCADHKKIKPVSTARSVAGDTPDPAEAPGSVLGSDYFDGILTWYLESGSTKELTPAPEPQRLAIKFDGAIVKKGAAPGESSLLCGKQKTIKKTSFSESDQKIVTETVKTFFASHDLNIEVVPDGKISSAETTSTVILAEDPKFLGCPEWQNAPYVSPLDIDNISPFDVAIVFAGGNLQPKSLADLVIAAASRTFGAEDLGDSDAMVDQLLENIGPAPAPVVTKPAPGDEPGDLPTVNPAYEDKPREPIAASGLSLGKYAKDLKGMPGLDFLAGIGASLPEVPEDQAIDTSLIEDRVKKAMPGPVTYPGFNRVLTIIEISKLAARKRAAEESQPTDDDKMQAVSRGLLKPSSLIAIGGVAAMASIGGFASIPAATAAAGQVYSNIKDEMPDSVDPNSLTLPAQSKDLPDFAAYLEIDKIDSIKDLIKSFKAHAYIVRENYSGAEQEALLSLLKVAYAQVYQKNIRPNIAED